MDSDWSVFSEDNENNREQKIPSRGGGDRRNPPFARHFLSWSESSQRNWGPLIHRCSCMSDSTVCPRDASSAGFDFVSTYLHLDGEENVERTSLLVSGLSLTVMLNPNLSVATFH